MWNSQYSGLCYERLSPPVYDLPEDSNSYELIYNEDMGATLIELDGRTYSLFGKLKGAESDDYIMRCLGFVGNDENVRIYSLTDDAFFNYVSCSILIDLIHLSYDQRMIPEEHCPNSLLYVT